MRTALRVGGMYTFIVGVLLLIPPWAAAVFGRPVMDAAVVSGWGTALIPIGLIQLVAASDAAKYAGLAWTIVVGFLLAAADLIYFWTTGAYTARHVLVPIILNVAIAGWIWSARPKA